MTETEWRTPAEPWAMLRWLERRVSDRKCWLFFAAGCRRWWPSLMQHLPLLGEPACERSVLALERRADGAWDEETRTQGGSLLNVLQACAVESQDFETAAALRDARVRRSPVNFRALAEDVIRWGFPRSHDPQAGAVALLRELFGNPFRPVTLDPAWDTPLVAGLAAAVYEERGFERLPILADALEDAGCEDADLLGHLRDPAPHVRGCWALDLILGRE
jgi:hypothetical protein